VLTPGSHNGAACPTMVETSACIDQVCDCDKVHCRFEQHACSSHYAATRLDGAAWAPILDHTNVGVSSAYRQGSTQQGVHEVIGPVGVRGQRVGRRLAEESGVTILHKHHTYTCQAGDTGCEMTHGDAYGTAAGVVDTHRESAVCNDESIRVYHDKDERKHLRPEGAEPGQPQTAWENEGHHCKLVGVTCSCKCHKMFRHAYNPHSLNTNAKTSAAYDYQCGPTTSIVCDTGV
jgi:hypothetical protein